MNVPHFLIAGSLVVGFAAPLVAQDGRSRRSAEVTEDLGVIAEAPGDGKDGKGVAPPAEPKSKFRASVSMRSDFTTNAKLSGDHSSGDVLFLPGLELGYNTPLGHGFAFDIAAKVESVLYAKFDERAFISYSLPTTLEWRPTPHCPRIYIGVEPYRFDSFDTGDLITQAIGLSVGTDYGYAFNGGNSLAFIGYSYTHYYSDPTVDNRSTNRAIAGLAHQFKPQLYGQIYYAWELSNYENANRHDYKNLVACSLIYQFNRHLFGNISGSFVDSDSTQQRASYQAAIASLGLTWQF